MRLPFLQVTFTLVVVFAVDLNPRDHVLINFKRADNNSRKSSNSAFYLPPGGGGGGGEGEPLIIENRVKSALPPSAVIDSVTKIDLTEDWATPSNDPPERDARRYPFQNLMRLGGLLKGNGKVASRTNSEVLKINEMSCHYSGEDLYFRASLVALKRTDHPVVDNVSNDLCKIIKVKTEYRLKFEKDNFWNCGVTDCSNDLGTFFCLTVRFPTITGLRLKDDITVTLQCRTQDKTASHTTQINVKSLNTAARMAPRVASGGLKNDLQTDVGLFRKSYTSENLFDVKISPGGTVVLGEEILLRVLVRSGDGWRYSRIGEVSVQYIDTHQQQRVMNSLWLLDAEGCRNPDVLEICRNDQYRVTPLESYLVFESFMFDNMKETDEMVISVKVTGCLEVEDCNLKCPGDHQARRARSLIDQQPKANVTDWRSNFAFKVVRGNPKNESKVYDEAQVLVPYVLTTVVSLISIGLLCFVKKLLTQRSIQKK